MLRIARATEQDSAEVERLRLKAYHAAPEFQIDDERLVAWSRDDAEGIVLAAWHGDVMVSTTRGNLARDVAEAERLMECALAAIPLQYPALILCKGATSPEFGKHGLHSMLRYAFIHAARDSKLGSVTGAVFQGAPRTRLMRRLGYEYFTPGREWYSIVRRNAQALIAVLPSESFPMALSTLAREVDVASVPESLCKEIALSLVAHSADTRNLQNSEL